MLSHQCRAVLEGAPVVKRASTLDEAFPNCSCEPWSLTETNGQGIPNHEIVARVLTSPDDYNESTATIITSRLTQIYAMGMSLIRQGATDQEIRDTVVELLNGGAEERRLVGAIVTDAKLYRSFTNNDDQARWFGVYATDSMGKQRHGDVLGLTVSKTAQSKRRHKLAAELKPFIVPATEIEELLPLLREAGI